ncbi:hypothetical protein GPALN_011904 [Globodera pallida]|nr:hypothetical protein GPALN_011904 [Globodera pallida]
MGERLRRQEADHWRGGSRGRARQRRWNTRLDSRVGHLPTPTRRSEIGEADRLLLHGGGRQSGHWRGDRHGQRMDNRLDNVVGPLPMPTWTWRGRPVVESQHAAEKGEGEEDEDWISASEGGGGETMSTEDEEDWKSAYEGSVQGEHEQDNDVSEYTHDRPTVPLADDVETEMRGHLPEAPETLQSQSSSSQTDPAAAPDYFAGCCRPTSESAECSMRTDVDEVNVVSEWPNNPEHDWDVSEWPNEGMDGQLPEAPGTSHCSNSQAAVAYTGWHPVSEDWRSDCTTARPTRLQILDVDRPFAGPFIFEQIGVGRGRVTGVNWGRRRSAQRAQPQSKPDTDTPPSPGPCYCCYEKLEGEDFAIRSHSGALPCRVCGCRSLVPVTDVPFGHLPVECAAEDTCSVCLEELLGRSVLVWCAGCGHPVHWECLETWRKKLREIEVDNQTHRMDSAFHHAAMCPDCRCYFYTGEAGPKLAEQRPIEYAPLGPNDNDDDDDQDTDFYFRATPSPPHGDAAMARRLQVAEMVEAVGQLRGDAPPTGVPEWPWNEN